jgi:hypothetical protein
MTTRKQKHEAAVAKREKFLEELRQSNTRNLIKVKAREAQIKAQAELKKNEEMRAKRIKEATKKLVNAPKGKP